MQRQRGELVPIGEALAGMGGPVKSIREASPQARHHFTRFDQVNQLVSASELDPDRGFMARMLVLCSLPRTNPGNRLQYKRTNGPYKLIMSVTGDHKLPFGNLPRLLLAWVCTEAVRTGSRELVLGRSLSKFMRALGINSDSGGARGEQTRLRNQMKRLFGCTVSLIYKDEHGEVAVNSLIADRTAFWWNERKTRPALAMGQQDISGRGVLQRDHPPSGAARHEHPQGAQTVLPGSRLVSLAGVPDLPTSRSAADHLAAGVPPVRSGPDPRQRQGYCPQLPT